jgi:hypothetical protein
MLMTRVSIPRRKRARTCGHKISIPTPRKRIPRTMTAKYRMGMRKVKYWITWGILVMGKMIPDSMVIVSMMRKVTIMDCSWVCTMVEINIPNPRVDRR